MIATIEISMYPLREDYKEQVLSFLEILSKEQSLDIRVNALSTQVKGELEEVLNRVSKAIEKVYSTEVKASFVLKILPGDIDLDFQYNV